MKSAARLGPAAEDHPAEKGAHTGEEALGGLERGKESIRGATKEVSRLKERQPRLGSRLLLRGGSWSEESLN